MLNCIIRYYILYDTIPLFIFFFFTDPPTPDIYTLSLHDALPISRSWAAAWAPPPEKKSQMASSGRCIAAICDFLDRKSTRLNSSHRTISYAVFCLKKKKKKQGNTPFDIIYSDTIG